MSTRATRVVATEASRASGTSSGTPRTACGCDTTSPDDGAAERTALVRPAGDAALERRHVRGRIACFDRGAGAVRLCSGRLGGDAVRAWSVPAADPGGSLSIAEEDGRVALESSAWSAPIAIELPGR